MENKPMYKILEEKYAQFTGAKYAVSCSSGTAALHLALLALGISKEDEVILPDFTMAACGFAVSYCGATPVFIDCDDRLCIDVSLIERKITKKTKAIMAVHIYGRLCDMKEIHRIAKKYDLYIIEDAAEAQGAVYKSKADITCYSFYENKIIHAEEGGICTTNNKSLADKMNYYKNMCFTPEHDYMHKHIGYNYRMPNAQAILALQSLEFVADKLAIRREWEHNLIVLNTQEQFGIEMPHRDVVWVYDYIGAPLSTAQTRPFFKPLSSFPMFGGVCQSPKAEYYSKIGNYLKFT